MQGGRLARSILPGWSFYEKHPSRVEFLRKTPFKGEVLTKTTPVHCRSGWLGSGLGYVAHCGLLWENGWWILPTLLECFFKFSHPTGMILQNFSPHWNYCILWHRDKTERAASPGVNFKRLWVNRRVFSQSNAYGRKDTICICNMQGMQELTASHLPPVIAISHKWRPQHVDRNWHTGETPEDSLDSASEACTCERPWLVVLMAEK